MIINYGRMYKNSEKNIKRHHKELEALEKIKSHIKYCNDSTVLENHPISKLYGFERLKHGLNNYYSFNLCKNGGEIRLIFLIDREENEVIFEYISVKHYEDFKSKIKVG